MVHGECEPVEWRYPEETLADDSVEGCVDECTADVYLWGEVEDDGDLCQQEAEAKLQCVPELTCEEQRIYFEVSGTNVPRLVRPCGAQIVALYECQEQLR